MARDLLRVKLRTSDTKSLSFFYSCPVAHNKTTSRLPKIGELLTTNCFVNDVKNRCMNVRWTDWTTAWVLCVCESCVRNSCDSVSLSLCRQSVTRPTIRLLTLNNAFARRRFDASTTPKSQLNEATRHTLYILTPVLCCRRCCSMTPHSSSLSINDFLHNIAFATFCFQPNLLPDVRPVYK